MISASSSLIPHPSSLLIFVAAFLAGIINSIAGGGTLISFPALVWLGRNPILANATNAAALWPGSFAGMVGFRRDLATLPRWLFLLTIPSLIGGGVGAMLLLHTSTRTFNALVPWLIFGATMLLAFQEAITRRVRLHGNATFVFILQFLVSIYGGYFGAGMGILMLAALGLIGLTDLHQMNGLKNLLAICINGVAAIYFALSGAVIWSDAIVMAIAAIVGGFAGAKMAHKLGRRFVRMAVVVIGLGMTVALLMRK
ncbi:MAG TPA: sulfite exporter TauE/SafE family protein [Thermoanaerobaculia bacterium]|nr:sulfite exporter TauE/SafE family protein [Thermoanaerobaculia bacterium]